MPSLEVAPTAFWPLTLTFNPRRTIATTDTQAKGQRSLSSKDIVETDGQTDGADCIAFLANVIGNYMYVEWTDR